MEIVKKMLIFLLTIQLTGCMTHLNIHYAFEPFEMKEDGAVWTSSMVGTYEHNKKKTIQTNPYELRPEFNDYFT